MSLRAAFPVLNDTAYLNAGTYGPLPLAAIVAAASVNERAAEEGRFGAYGERLAADRELLRAAYADVLGADAADVAITASTSEGIVRVLGGLDLGPGDEIVTGDDEHPGLAAPLAALRDQRDVVITAVPLAEVANAVSPKTKLVACSHVSWATGALAPAELAQVDVPVLYDGAQAAGAIPIDLERLGASFYAGPGQKWLCGPEGLGMLWVAPQWHERLQMRGPAYINLADPARGDALKPGAARFDATVHPAALLAASLAAYDVLNDVGFEDIWLNGVIGAFGLAQRLRDAGFEVAPRGESTLVSWTVEDAASESKRLAASGVIVRSIPGTQRLRASVGAWNDSSDLDRLFALIS